MSRTVLREAYSVLSAKGLILARPRVGTCVRGKSNWNMLDPDVLTWHMQSAATDKFITDLFVLRKFVEPPAAALAALQNSDDAIEKISAAYENMARLRNGTEDLVDADHRFHVSILEATDNHFIGALGGPIHTALLSSFKLGWRAAAGMHDDRLQQHYVVFEAIRDKKPELASKCMTDLLNDSMKDVRKALRQRAEQITKN